MGLFETLQRKAVKLGLLPKLLAALPLLSALTAVVSVVMILIIPMNGQYRNTYISENALMPSQAYSYFRETEWNILRGYRTEIEVLNSRGVSASDRYDIVAGWLNEFGAKTAVYRNEEMGDTLYGVLHAPRGDGTEAMVLCAPWNNSEGEFNIGGSALAIALSRYFSRWPVWSKNIIVVFSDNPSVALRSWVEAYHTSLDLTGGSIEAAVILDYPSNNDYFNYTEIHFEGLNGELPNLDLVNVAVHITQHEGMKVSLHGLPRSELEKNNYWSRLKLLFLGMKDSTLAGMKKAHGNEVFSGWRIQAVTLKARGEGQIDITTFGRIPEAMFRSINNLLEKFHQSFFFYFLLSPNNFVSISSYLPSAVLLSITFAIAAVDATVNNAYASALHITYTLLAALASVISLLVSFLVAHWFLYSTTSPLYLILGSVVLAVSPLVMSRSNNALREPVCYRMRTLGYIYYSLILTSLLMLNFPLAFSIGLFGYPMTLVKPLNIYSKSQMSLKLRNSVLLVISNPFVATWLICTVVENSEFPNLDVFAALFSAWKDLNCWTWFVLCLGWLPTWLLVTFSSFTSIPAAETTIEKKSN
ncbi:GPI-anchor transamidase subunit GAA1 KNAG_0H03250 [Huiozyma naganishii CBS 8797]|uniref:GPI transamidase component GAA1 n=1 Tax=Huiozyma naganishii (strain ATCC MYA-139 / BCRC 22969 / CBS 8797 / KCTC 17520 / NBRC 10181 / NCYC 3082 / Yp74L-3) TaxID=1071383 RepID=J7RA38_HUIN7|nr:hypothetical protein KNAG_0H03250 [Kazachstania naganishii CBS 8797]CCK71740.1 hypothetical protein KNAG_0H03250 [Kazachstania naganishii CBS 8797]